MTALTDSLELFIAALRRAAGALDGRVPIAVVFAPATVDAADPRVVNVERRDFAVVWPTDFPAVDRGAVFRLLAEQYESGRTRIGHWRVPKPAQEDRP
jgi:hypothetical protein